MEVEHDILFAGDPAEMFASGASDVVIRSLAQVLAACNQIGSAR